MFYVASPDSRYSWPPLDAGFPELPQPLHQIPRVLDLPYKPTTIPAELRGRQYESECVDFLSQHISPDQNLFGPNLIMKALGRSFYTHHPTPDAMVFRPHQDGIALIEMSEFKLGSTESTRKVQGFSRLLGKIRTNREAFRDRFQEAVKDSFYIPPIYLPSNDEIEFTFATPWTIDEDETFQMHNTPCRIFFFRVPTDLKVAV